MGGLIVIVGFLVIIMVHEAGHLIATKSFGLKATEYFFGFGPKIWSFRRGETEYGAKALPLGGYVKVIGMSPFEEVDPAEEHRTYRGRPFWQKSIVVLAGVASHFVIAFFLFYAVDVFVGSPVFGDPSLRVGNVVATENGEPTAAATAGLGAGDRIVALNGSPVADWDAFAAALKEFPGQEITITVERNSQELTLTTTLGTRTRDGQTVGFLGVSPEVPQIGRDRENPIGGIMTASDQVAEATVASLQGLWSFVTNFGDFIGAVFGDDDVPDESRPVSVIGLTQLGAASSRFGLDLTLQLLAYLSIFVGVLNVLPLYPLDGGHFAVAFYEKVSGREPDVRRLAPVAAAVLIFIVTLGLLGLYFDIVDPIDFG